VDDGIMAQDVKWLALDRITGAQRKQADYIEINETCAEQNYRNWDVGLVTDACCWREPKLDWRLGYTVEERAVLCECEWR